MFPGRGLRVPPPGVLAQPRQRSRPLLAAIRTAAEPSSVLEHASSLWLARPWHALHTLTTSRRHRVVVSGVTGEPSGKRDRHTHSRVATLGAFSAHPPNTGATCRECCEVAATQRPNAIKPSAQVPFRAVGLSRPTNRSPSYSVARPPPPAHLPPPPEHVQLPPLRGGLWIFRLATRNSCRGGSLYLRFGDVSLARGGRNTRDGRVTSSRRDPAIMAAGQAEHASPSQAQSTASDNSSYDHLTNDFLTSHPAISNSTSRRHTPTH